MGDRMAVSRKVAVCSSRTKSIDFRRPGHISLSMCLFLPFLIIRFYCWLNQLVVNGYISITVNNIFKLEYCFCWGFFLLLNCRLSYDRNLPWFWEVQLSLWMACGKIFCNFITLHIQMAYLPFLYMDLSFTPYFPSFVNLSAGLVQKEVSSKIF